jgi:3-dehydroquinate synthase
MTTRTITVELGDRSYPIVIGSGLLAGGFDLSKHLAGTDCLIVSNETVAPLYLDKLIADLDASSVESISLPDGEAHKTVDTATTVLDKLVSVKANRDTTVVALGGGVVGDIAGFAAACYMRGVAFIQVPTTLLAQVDSSVGGKTGVNHPQGKNLIGAFHQPRIVLVDIETLGTLPDRELSAGLAEVIKYAAIADEAFLSWLEENISALLDKQAEALTYAIARSCEIKAEIVADDEREAGRRALLNFGHTFGHAIEHCMGYGEWLHGEAVAVGMIMAAEFSGIAAADVQRLRNIVAAAGLLTAPPAVDATALLAAMQMDKKIKQKRLNFILLRALGDAFLTSEYDESRLQNILETTE